MPLLVERWYFAVRARVAGIADRLRGSPDMDAEAREHVERSIEHHVKAGLPWKEARRAALRDIGGLQQLKESCQDVRRVDWFENLLHDVGAALRQLRRSPGFAAVAVTTVAVGIGANTAVFSVVNGVLLKPLPFPDSDRLVGLWHAAPGLNLTDVRMAPSQYIAYRQHRRAFEDIGLWSSSTASVTQLSQPEQVDTLLVTDGTLSLLGVVPAFGRLFSAEDCADGSPDTVLLSHEFWQSRFGGDASIIGR